MAANSRQLDGRRDWVWVTSVIKCQEISGEDFVVCVLLHAVQIS